VSANDQHSGQRALWTFLMHTLVAPFLGAVVILLLTLGAGLMGAGPTSLKNLAPDELLPKAANWAVVAYVWSAMPAAIAGSGLAVLAYARGTYGWLEAAVFAAVAVTIAGLLSGGIAADHVTAIAIIASLVAIAVRFVLIKGRVLR